ncbi:MAG: hypothetical protein HY904_00690 [Deltaproteobacteria bacterium]|nr:hypothetical protein [Deltaproteobacteria bacterium]
MWCGAQGDCLGSHRGTECPGAKMCVNGFCDIACNAPLVRCVDATLGAVCVDPAVSTGFCGAQGDCLGANAGAQCAPGEECQGASGCVCTAANGCCTTNADCADTRSCEAGVCVDNPTCTTHAECPTDQYCSAGVCHQGPQCTGDADCPAALHCATGRCEPNPGCTGDAECPLDQSCVNNVCTRNPTCDTANPCTPPLVCNNGSCVRPTDCAGTLSDNVGCTVDTCDTATGTAIHTPDDAACDDGNACTIDTCDRVNDCQRAANPSPVQVAGDCKTVTCNGTSVVLVDDNNDTPAADTVACTVEECVGGVPAHRPDHGACPNNGACNVGFCDPAGGCGTRTPDVDQDGHTPVACGGDDCLDTDNTAYTGHAEVPADGVDNNCNGYTDEGAGVLSCPAAPVGKRILDTITLTAAVAGATAGSWSLRWSIVAEPAQDSLALSNVASLSVTFTPVIRGNYTMRATLTQVGAAEQTCDVAFTIAGPDEDMNVQLVMHDPVDVDIHLLHPVGGANGAGYFWEFNWGPVNNYSWSIGGFPTVYVTNLTEEGARAYPDCHYYNCTSCTVTVPGQPACGVQTLQWSGDYYDPTYVATLLYSFGNFTADAYPKLDIDNRRGCYVDGNGERVCTPENISIKHPATGTYTIAIHYYGEPVVEGPPGTFTGNQRGVPAAGFNTVDVDVEVYCKNTGFKRYTCSGIPADGWCFVTDAAWNSATGQCTFNAPTSRDFPYGVLTGINGYTPPQFYAPGVRDSVYAVAQ